MLSKILAPVWKAIAITEFIKAELVSNVRNWEGDQAAVQQVADNGPKNS